MEETAEKSKLFEVKKVIVNPQQEDDSELIKCLEEGYAIIEKIEQTLPRGIKRTYILRKDLSLSNDERDEYERLKKNEEQRELRMLKFVDILTDCADVNTDVISCLNIITDRIKNFSFFNCSSRLNINENCTDVILTVRVTGNDIYDYQHKKGE